MKDRNFITRFGLFSTIIVTVVGVGAFSYPRDLAATVGTDGWIVTILGGIISYLLLYLSYKVIKANNYNKLQIILSNNLGRVFGGILALIFAMYNIFSVAIGMRVFVEVIKMYLLEKTPTEFLLIVTIFTGTYLVRNELDTLIKFNQVSFWIMFIPVITIILFTLNKTDFTNILPIFNNKPTDYINGLKTTIYSFAGIEIIYLVGPFTKEKLKIPKVVMRSIFFIILFYVFIVVFSLAVFSKEQTKILLWPTITMIKSINIQGAFVERWEGVVMSMWVIFYFTTFSNIYYLSSDIVKDVFNLGDIKISSAIIAPLIYLVALYPQNIAEVYNISNKYIPVLAIYSLFVLPIILFLFRPSKKKVV